MGAGGEKWTRIYAAYRAGMGLREICRKHKVSMRDLLKKIREDDWRRPGDDPKPDNQPASNTAVILSPAVRETVDQLVQETLDGILAEHKNMARQLRVHYDQILAEFQEMCLYMASFLDKNYIQSLSGEPDNGAKLREFLKQAVIAFAKRVDVLAKLSSVGRGIVDLDNLIWKTDDPHEGEEGWDELVADLRENKHKPQALPPEVVDFEKRLAQREKSGK